MDVSQLRAEVVRLRASEDELREEVAELDADALRAEKEVEALKAKLADAHAESAERTADADMEELVLELEEVRERVFLCV